MTRSRIPVVIIVALGCLLLPSVARAQSAFTGVVKDTSGAVLPGVTVEVASPVLIEKTRSVVTDENGAYRLVDLRPGVYTVTFTLPGFATVKRENVELESNFVMTLNSDMKVGALEETVTVSGSSPVVDVQTTTKSQVLSRDVLDAVPTGRTIQGMGQLITGVSLNAPDVGGSRAMQQTYMSAHGSGASQTTVQVDGLMVNGLDVDGAVQNYFNSSMSQEMVYTTSGASADVSGGGVRLNMIPRDGGNTFAGSVFGGYQTKGFQTDNLTDDLQARGLRSTDGIDKLYNMEASLGGPIKKDKIWFFMSARTFHLDTLPADVFLASGPATATAAPPRGTEPGVDPQKIDSAQAADHLADLAEAQVRVLQRSARQGPRRGDDRRLRPGDRVDRVGLADLHDRIGQDHLHAEQQAPVRRRRLVQLRALPQPLPGRHREGSRHA